MKELKDITIAIIEDDGAFVEAFAENLGKTNIYYYPDIKSAYTDIIEKETYKCIDVFIIDILLPKEGLDLLGLKSSTYNAGIKFHESVVKKTGIDFPVLFISAVSGSADITREYVNEFNEKRDFKLKFGSNSNAEIKESLLRIVNYEDKK